MTSCDKAKSTKRVGRQNSLRYPVENLSSIFVFS